MAIDVLLKNNTGNKDKDVLIEGFVVRIETFTKVIEEIRKFNINKSGTNFLLTGQRGSGKTTLLYRLKYAMEDDPKLHWLIPIMLPEEQYFINDLDNLWEAVAEQLDEHTNYHGIIQEVESIVQAGAIDYERKIFDFLVARLKKHDHRIILFLENIDMLLKKFGAEGKDNFWHALKDNRYINILASSTKPFEDANQNGSDFSNLLKIVNLYGLSKNDTETLLLKIADFHGQSKEIENIIETNPKRIESLRRLTGGVPRTIAYLFQIFMDNENGKTLKDLYRLVDELSVLYKSELDQLSGQQQKIVDVIAKKWDAISASEIARKTRLDSKHVSSILKQLEKSQVIETLSTKTKNNLYRIRERFLNIWYLMRFGKRKDKEKVIWLVRFYDIWCDRSDLAKKISDHIDNLKKGSYDPNAAFDMGMTFLSCQKTPLNLKLDLYETTKALLPKQLVESLKLSDQEIYKIIKKSLKEGNVESAFSTLDHIEDKESPEYYLGLSLIYFRTKRYIENSEILEKYYNKYPKPETAFQIAALNEFHINNFDKALIYYNKALEARNFNAAHRIGHIYYEEYNDFEKAKEYFTLAINNHVRTAIICLAEILENEGQFSEAEKYYDQAVDLKLNGALRYLGLLYSNQERYEEAERTLNHALELGDNQALIGLGILQLRNPKASKAKAKEYFADAIKKGIPAGYYSLGKFYFYEEKNIAKAEKNLLEASKHGLVPANHTLGHLYFKKKDYESGEKHFLLAYENGDIQSLLCFANCVLLQKVNGKRKFVIDLLEANLARLSNSKPLASLLYAQLLVWDKNYKKAQEVFNAHTDFFKARLEDTGSNESKALMEELTFYFILLLSKQQYDFFKEIFTEEIDSGYSEIFKPIRYAYQMLSSPTNAPIISDEFSDTVSEILDDVKTYSKQYK